MPSYWATAEFGTPDWEKAHYLAILNRLTYQQNALSFDNWGQAAGKTSSGRNPFTGTGSAPSWDYVNGTDYTIISWAGCTELRQFIDYTRLSLAGAAHLTIPGFVSQYIVNCFNGARTLIDNLCNSTPSTHKVLLAGHSLGGALAQYCAAYIKAKTGDRSRIAGVYAFGSPKIGSRAFVDYCDFPVHNIRTEGDPVPALPPNLGTLQWMAPSLFSPAFGRVVIRGPELLTAGTAFSLPEFGYAQQSRLSDQPVTWENARELYPVINYSQIGGIHGIETYIERLSHENLKPMQTPIDGVRILAVNAGLDTASYSSLGTAVPLPPGALTGIAGQQVPPSPLPATPPTAAIQERMISQVVRQTEVPIRVNVPGQPPQVIFQGGASSAVGGANAMKGHDREILKTFDAVCNGMKRRDSSAQSQNPTTAVSTRQLMLPPEYKQVNQALELLQNHVRNMLAQKA